MKSQSLVAFLRANNIPLHVYTMLFIHSSADGHLPVHLWQCICLVQVSPCCCESALPGFLAMVFPLSLRKTQSRWMTQKPWRFPSWLSIYEFLTRVRETWLKEGNITVMVGSGLSACGQLEPDTKNRTWRVLHTGVRLGWPKIGQKEKVHKIYCVCFIDIYGRGGGQRKT